MQGQSNWECVKERDDVEIRFTKDAVKQINALDKPVKNRIKEAIYALPKGDIKKLKGYSTKYRLRVGNYRIVYDITGDTIVIGAILPRGDVYKKI